MVNIAVLNVLFPLDKLMLLKSMQCLLRFLFSVVIMCKFSHFLSFHDSIAGKANLDKSDLEPALKALKDRLMTKNVVCSPS